MTSLTEELPFQIMRRTWQPVALGRELAPGGVIGRRLLGAELVLARFEDGALLAADAACLHKGRASEPGRAAMPVPRLAV